MFVVSWVNPDEKLAEKGFEDYMREGSRGARRDRGGHRRDARSTSSATASAARCCRARSPTWRRTTTTASSPATFFVTLIDFREAGELSVFIDEEQLKALEEKMNKRGYLEGSEMATTFNMLRANDLIWSFVVNNYLLGNDPFPFDLLYWNADSTRMPARMHSFYLRKMYQENLLVEPGGITLAGVPIDLRRRSRCPAYFLSTREDHIAPWQATYRGTQLLRRPEPLRAGRLGPHRRRGQPARRRQIQPLDQRRTCRRRSGGLVRRRHRDRRLVVAGLAPLGHRARQARRCRRACPATAS